MRLGIVSDEDTGDVDGIWACNPVRSIGPWSFGLVTCLGGKKIRVRGVGRLGQIEHVGRQSSLTKNTFRFAENRNKMHLLHIITHLCT